MPRRALSFFRQCLRDSLICQPVQRRNAVNFIGGIASVADSFGWQAVLYPLPDCRPSDAKQFSKFVAVEYRHVGSGAGLIN